MPSILGPSILALALSLFVAGSAFAVPRYTARYQQNCTLCHQNPTGGGMRSLYATQYLVPNELSMRKLSDEAIDKIHPDVSTSVTLGADFRTMWAWADEDSRPERNFFQMQGDLYASFALHERISANMNVDQVANVEAYGLAWVLPWSGYIKAGRFTPVFGWKFEDHNRFNREELWFDQPFNTDAGVEVGIYPKHLAVWAPVLNGERGSNPIWDSNREVAIVGGALAQFELAQLAIGIGGSFWQNAREPASGTTGRRTAGGPFGYLHWKGLAYLWEVDASRLTITNISSKTVLLTAHELSYVLRPGLDLVGTYDYVDRDLDLKTGTRSRYGVGIECVPTAFVELQANVNYYDSESGADAPEPSFTRTELQVHLYY
jgi:hypothetical protein